MSLITARFSRNKEDGFTVVHIKSAAVEGLVKAACLTQGRTTDVHLGDWQVSVDGGRNWRSQYKAHSTTFDALASCGFFGGSSEYPLYAADGRPAALSCAAIAAVGLGSEHGVMFRTKRPVAPSSLREAAKGLERGVQNLVEASRSVDITVTGVAAQPAKAGV